MLDKRTSTKTGYELPRSEREQIKEIAQKYGILRVRLFGSVARGEANSKSDVDLLVELPPRTNLFTLVAIKQELEDSLHRPVDVVSEAALSPYLRDQVLQEAVSL